jgi:hypothetical protein
MTLDPSAIITHGTPPSGAPTTELCNYGGHTIPRRARPFDPCPICGHQPQARMHGAEPSQRTAAPTVDREKSIDVATATFNAEVAACLVGGEGTEQHLRAAKRAATELGRLVELQSGRASTSVRDERLTQLRRTVSELAHRLERDAWT